MHTLRSRRFGNIRVLFAIVASSMLLFASGLAQSSPAHALTAFGDTSQSDFNKGATEDSSVTADGGGAVGMAPGSANFNSLPAAWPFTQTAAGGSASVNGGVLSVDGGYVQSPNTSRPGISVVMKVSFSRVQNQSVGISKPGNPASGLAFSTGTSADGYLWVSRPGAAPAKLGIQYGTAPVILKIDVTSSGGSQGTLAPSRFSIWNGSSWNAPNALSGSDLGGELAVFASDTATDARPLVVDYLETSPWLSHLQDCDGTDQGWSMGGVVPLSVTYSNGICTVGDTTIFAGPLGVRSNYQVDFVGVLRKKGSLDLENSYEKYNTTYKLGFRSNATTPYAFVNAPGLATTQWVLPNSLIDTSHIYRITMLSDRVELSVPDVPSIPVMTALGIPQGSYYQPTVSASTLDKILATPLAGSADHTGQFTSRTIDAGSSVNWNALNWNGTVPANSTATFEARAGSSAIPDGSWSSWASVGNSGGALDLNGRFAQYRIHFTSIIDRVNPSITEVTFTTASSIPPPAQRQIYVSGPNTQGYSIDGGATWQPVGVVPATETDPTQYGTVPGTQWVSDSTYGYDRGNSSTKFRMTFGIPAPASSPKLNICLLFDDYLGVTVNGVALTSANVVATPANYGNATCYETTQNLIVGGGASANTVLMNVDNGIGPLGVDYAAEVSWIN